MLFNSLLISSFLYASVVLADHRFGKRDSSILNHTEGVTTRDVSSPVWAGAFWPAAENTFDYVVGTFTVPSVTGEHGSSASAWVGIDGDICNDVLFSTGIHFSIDGNGKPSYFAWYQWHPDQLQTFDIAISAGDEVRVWVHAYFPTSGIAKIHNLSTNKYEIQLVNSAHALCGLNAMWFVENLQFDGKQVPLANFGTVTFKDTKATGSPGSRTTSGATVVNMVQNSRTRASTRIDRSTVTVKYV